MRAVYKLLICSVLWSPSRAFPPLHLASCIGLWRTVNTTRRRMRNGTCSWPGAKLVERTGKGLSLTVADQVGITHLAALSDRDCPRYRSSPESATGKRKQSLRGHRELHAVNMAQRTRPCG